MPVSTEYAAALLFFRYPSILHIGGKFYILSGISKLFKENVSYWLRVFFSETLKTEIIIEPFSSSIIVS